jgi:hypothetical protein
MKIGGALVDGAAKQPVDEADHRGIARGFAQPIEFRRAEARAVDGRILGTTLLAFGVIGRQQAFERGIEVGRQRDEANDRAAGEQPDRFDRLLVRRVGHRERHGGVEIARIGWRCQRQHACVAQKRGTEIGIGNCFLCEDARFHDPQSARLRKGVRHVLFGHMAQAREGRGDAFAGFRGKPARARQGVGTKLSRGNQGRERPVLVGGRVQDGRRRRNASSRHWRPTPLARGWRSNR